MFKAKMFILSSPTADPETFFNESIAGYKSMGNSNTVDESAEPDDKPMESSSKQPKPDPSSPTVSSKPRNRTRQLKKRKFNNKCVSNNVSMFSIVGQNAAGILSKKNSLSSLMKKLLPSIGLFQETKVRKPGMIKIPGNQIFEKNKE